MVEKMAQTPTILTLLWSEISAIINMREGMSTESNLDNIGIGLLEASRGNSVALYF